MIFYDFEVFKYDLYIPLRSYKTHAKQKFYVGGIDFISHYVHIKQRIGGLAPKWVSPFISHYVHIKPSVPQSNANCRRTLYPTTFI